MAAKVGMIWAEDRCGVLGMNQGMAWHVPADFRFFRDSTMGCPLIMGRTTWQSLSGSLPGRYCIVLSSHPQQVLSADGSVPDACVSSMDEALVIAHDYAQRKGSHHVWIAGGSQVYREAYENHRADELVVTTIDLDVASRHPTSSQCALAYAPRIDPATWRRDPARSDKHWREKSGDASWRVTTWVPAEE